MKLELWYPVKKPGIASQGFGPSKTAPDLLPMYKKLGLLAHNGIDYPLPRGTPIRAAHNGLVVYAGMDSNGGWGVVIRTQEPFDYNNDLVFAKSIYWHLLPNIPVKVGAQVKAGDIIGYADTTGLATGSHLHFGLKPQLKVENDWTWYNVEQNNGYNGSIDPAPYWNGYYAEDAQTIISIMGQQISILQKLVSLMKLALGK